MKLLLSALVSFFLSAWTISQAEILSPFSGSEPVGVYETDYARFHYLIEVEDAVETAIREGQLTSRIFQKPEDKSNYEVFKSFERELNAAGFEMLAVLENVSQAELLARAANRPEQNNFLQRTYTYSGKAVPLGTKARVSSQGQEYLAATKTVDQTEIIVVVNTSRAGAYVIEEFQMAAMEQGTVTLSLEALNDAIATEGRVALYGIQFDTGSATIQTDSADALAIIVAYLEDHPDQHFYVVGHTDDQGNLASNLALSTARAEAVVMAIISELPSAEARLIARGVGPLSPVATNGAENGRALNRRVELVSTHP